MFARASLAVPVLTTLLIAAFLVLLLLGLVAWKLRSRNHHDGTHAPDNVDTLVGWPPQATRVLTSAERQGYDVLRSAFPAHMILAQVPLQRFIKVPTRYSYADWLRRVGQLNADLVVCDRHSQVVAVVEIQGEEESPHSRVHRRRERMMRVLKTAEIPVHVWSAAALPSVGAVREAIAATQEPEDQPVAGRKTFAPGRTPTVAGQPATAGSAAEAVPMREPPPSTWFDDFDSAPAPLASDKAKAPSDAKPRH